MKSSQRAGSLWNRFSERLSRWSIVVITGSNPAASRTVRFIFVGFQDLMTTDRRVMCSDKKSDSPLAVMQLKFDTGGTMG